MSNSLSHLVVAITGASSGIGAAIARTLSARGAHIILGARRLDRMAALVAEIREAGGVASASTLDVTQRASMDRFVAEAIALHKRIDVLVNNAGVMPLSRMDALDVAGWERTFDVNVKGVLYGIAAVLPHMQRHGRGHIVNIASIGAHRS